MYPLHQAIMNGQTNVVLELIEDGTDVNALDYNEDYPLSLAILMRDVISCTHLLKGGAMPNGVDPEGSDLGMFTPMHAAVAVENIDLFREMIRMGATFEVFHVDDDLFFDEIFHNTLQKYKKYQCIAKKEKSAMVLQGFYSIIRSKNVANDLRVEPENLFDTEFSEIRNRKLGIDASRFNQLLI